MTKEDSPVGGYIAAMTFGVIVTCLLLGYLSAWLYNICQMMSLSQNPHTAPNDNDILMEVIPIHDLDMITNNFNEQNILGTGGSAIVYKGIINNSTTVAVKRIMSVDNTTVAKFNNEINILKKVSHRHVVRLCSYCSEGNQKFIVYEYMPQGTLSRHLFRWSEEGLEPLQWNRRLGIALDVAKGVEYLHQLSPICIIHRDLKPSNILLGADMTAKVGDFGIACEVPNERFSTEVEIEGTPGYWAPECIVIPRVTPKVDVYSFGVILLELITGRKANDSDQPEDKELIVPWFKKIVSDKNLFHRAIDPAIVDRDESTLHNIDTVAALAYHCIANEENQRPDMQHVVFELTKLTTQWEPPVLNSEDIQGNESQHLPTVLEGWKVEDQYNMHPSIPNDPQGFASSSTPTDEKMKGPIVDEAFP